MRNMTTMKQRLFKITTFGLLTTLIASCGADKPTSTTSDKITFPTVEFTISATSDTTVFGQQGTRLFIEKGTFQFADGTPVTDSIKMQVKEFYRKSDITLADLSTESDGKLLETGGMLNITATAKGQGIEIKGDKRIVVHFPKSKDSYKQMNLFFADKSATDTSVTNWDIDTVSLVKSTIQILSWGYYYLDINDSTPVTSKPKNFVDTGYYWNPLELYVNKFDFSKSTIQEINNYTADYYVGVEFDINKSGKILNPIVSSKVSKNAQKELLNFVNGLPELTPSKDKNGNIVTRRAILGLSKGQIIPLYKSREEYLSSFDKKYSRFEKQPIKNMNDAELDYYVFSVAKLGWINCDRFLESEKTVDYFVKTQEKDTKIKMVFKDIDGVLMANSTDGKFIFSKVPIGRQVTIVAIKNTNGQFQTAFQEVTISDKPLEALAFKETTLSELKQQLEKLN
jgi:hypothetical protein